MQSVYSKKVLKRFFEPKYMEKMKNPDACGKVGNPVCGDILEMYIKVGKKKNKKEYIKKASFLTLGCPAAISVSDMICEMIEGKTIEQASKIKFDDVLKKLGKLPAIKIHCLILGIEVLKKTIKNYKKNKNKK